MAADELRRCYDAWMNTPDAGRIRVRWFFVPPQTPWITDAYDYRSSNWDEYPGYDPPLGEESSTRQPFTDWADGTPPPGCDCCPRASLRLVAGGTAAARSTAGATGVSYAPIAWWSADALTGLTNGQPITTWPDNSGNGHALVQSDPSLAPSYIERIVGFPAVSVDRPTAANVQGGPLLLGNSHAMYVVGFFPGGGNPGGFSLANTAGDGASLAPDVGPSAWVYRDSRDTYRLPQFAIIGDFTLWGLVRNGTWLTLSRNGVPQATADLRSAGVVTLGVLQESTQGVINISGMVIFEIVVLPYTPDATEDAYWTHYLKTRWGITP